MWQKVHQHQMFHPPNTGKIRKCIVKLQRLCPIPIINSFYSVTNKCQPGMDLDWNLTKTLVS